MNTEERVKLIEEAIIIMKNLVLRHGERLDTFDEDLRRSREDFDFKMNAVIDAQVKNETEILEMKSGISDLRSGVSELKDASHSQLSPIERLETQ
jgi:hypothetical protein